MRIAEAAGSLICISFAVHLILWRTRLPKRQTAAILLIFLGLLPVFIAALLWIRPLRALGPWGFWSCAHIAVCQVGVALGYAVFYSVLEATSPTLRSVLFVSSGGTAGRTPEDVAAMLKRATSIETKLEAMVRDQMLTEEGGFYGLTPKGHLWAKTFAAGRRYLGLAKGG